MWTWEGELINLHELYREARHAEVHGVTESDTTERLNNNKFLTGKNSDKPLFCLPHGIGGLKTTKHYVC